jgi:hypothetical protein
MGQDGPETFTQLKLVNMMKDTRAALHHESVVWALACR